MGALTKRSGGDGSNNRDVWVVGDGGFENNYPELCSFLSAQSWPDGSDRVTGTLLLFTDDGSLKACLADRDQGLVAFCSANAVDGLLDALEAGLREDALDWRRSKHSPGRKPGRRS